MDRISRYASPLGEITLAGDGDALIGLWFAEQAHFGAGLREPVSEGSAPVLEDARRWLDVYFSGRAPDFTPRLAPRGTDFQKAVWAQLLQVPRGGTLTYGELARRLGTAPRAVGSAVGRNPISLIIPCHRVVGADGSLTGYAGGLERKQYLLRMEQA